MKRTYNLILTGLFLVILPSLSISQSQTGLQNRPQEPKPPLPYRSVEVIIHNAQDGINLSGTLTLPEKAGKYPVAVLVSGSGPQNRDAEILGHKPFLVLSDYLTRNGIAVLRYDDRGVGKSQGVFKTASTYNFAADANAAFEFLKTHPEADTSKIGFIGNSEGALAAAMATAARPDVAFMVMMAGPGVVGEQILNTQSRKIALAVGADEATIKADEKLQKDIYTVLKKNKDDDKAGAKIRSLMESFYKKQATSKDSAELSEAQLAKQIETLTSAWFRNFLTINPEDYLRKVTCPVLAINGSLDLQVDARENLEAIEKALIFGGNANYTIEELPDLNHLFQTAKSGSPDEYEKIDETISPVVLELIGKWVISITR